MNKFKKNIMSLVLVSAITLSLSTTSFAHKMVIEPIDNGKVQVNYDGGNAATRAEVQVFDKDGKILEEGSVDEDGFFEYENQEASYLEADDGMGHKDKWEVGNKVKSTSGSKLPKIAGVVVVLGLVGFLFSRKKK